jgi:hypothetical protein
MSTIFRLLRSSLAADHLAERASSDGRARPRRSWERRVCRGGRGSGTEDDQNPGRAQTRPTKRWRTPTSGRGACEGRACQSTGAWPSVSQRSRLPPMLPVDGVVPDTTSCSRSCGSVPGRVPRGWWHSAISSRPAPHASRGLARGGCVRQGRAIRSSGLPPSERVGRQKGL